MVLETLPGSIINHSTIENQNHMLAQYHTSQTVQFAKNLKEICSAPLIPNLIGDVTNNKSDPRFFVAEWRKLYPNRKPKVTRCTNNLMKAT